MSCNGSYVDPLVIVDNTIQGYTLGPTYIDTYFNNEGFTSNGWTFTPNIDNLPGLDGTVTKPGYLR